MSVKRMDNVGIVVEDIDAAIEFFTELGLVLEGRAPIEGEWADDVTGLRRVRITPRNGQFTFELLLPGDYSVLVQRFGYRPRLYRRVPVRAGSRIRTHQMPSSRPGGTTR